MSALVGWVIAAAVCGIVFLVLLIIAIVKRNFAVFYAALAAFLVLMVCGAMAAWSFADSAYARVQHALEPRSGLEIYSALLGAPEACVQVIASQDQVIPKIDTAIRLHVTMCPAELRRLLLEGGYSMERVQTTPSAQLSAFATEQLGDTVLRFHKEVTPGKNWRTIDVRTDSTEAIIEDVLD